MRKTLWNIIDENTIDGKVLCKCACGKEKMVLRQNVVSNKSFSCGCGGKTFVPKNVRRTFNLMNYRCSTKTSPDYHRWGGRGIKVLYVDVQEFYKDVGNKPSAKHSIDRINGEKNYEVGNCRWATCEVQTNNTSSNINLTHNGVTKSISIWARELNIHGSTIRERLKRGWSVPDSLSKSVEKKHNWRMK